MNSGDGHADQAGDYVDEAAEIWAEATTARDGDADVPPLQMSRSVIEGVVTISPRSLLLVALNTGGRVVGFAAAEPVSPTGDTSELRYLGVQPES